MRRRCRVPVLLLFLGVVAVAAAVVAVEAAARPSEGALLEPLPPKLPEVADIVVRRLLPDEEPAHRPEGEAAAAA